MSRATEETRPVPGTQPDGISDEAEAARRVREMFTRIAPRYDLLNRVISFRTDVIWRRRVAARFHDILQRPDARVLDLCCGTGDLAFALERSARRSRAVDSEPGAQIYGADFAHPMLVLARKKAEAMGSDAAFIEADAMRLPLADASVDLVTSPPSASAIWRTTRAGSKSRCREPCTSRFPTSAASKLCKGGL